MKLSFSIFISRSFYENIIRRPLNGLFDFVFKFDVVFYLCHIIQFACFWLRKTIEWSIDPIDPESTQFSHVVGIYSKWFFSK